MLGDFKRECYEHLASLDAKKNVWSFFVLFGPKKNLSLVLFSVAHLATPRTSWKW